MSDLKQQVQATIAARQLTSILNRTKWMQLQKAVLEELPFSPAFQVKYVLDQNPYPENFEYDVWYWGDWLEGLEPFYHVEWIRVRPYYMTNNLEEIDITDKFISVLQKRKIPFVFKRRTVYIYGYVQHMGIFYDENETSV